MKRCSCGREYCAETFTALRLKGWVGCFWSGGKAMAVELRDCSDCGSTIGIEVGAPKKKRQLKAKLAKQTEGAAAA